MFLFYYRSRRVLEGVSSPLVDFLEELRKKERSKEDILADMDTISVGSLASSHVTFKFPLLNNDFYIVFCNAGRVNNFDFLYG